MAKVTKFRPPMRGIRKLQRCPVSKKPKPAPQTVQVAVWVTVQSRVPCIQAWTLVVVLQWFHKPLPHLGAKPAKLFFVPNRGLQGGCAEAMQGF